MAVLKHTGKPLQLDSKTATKGAGDLRVAFVFSLAKKRQKQRLTGI
jgi:hypothetical protein